MRRHFASVVRSIREAGKHASEVTRLDLTTGKELQCVNIMCENVGERCACRLALWFTQRQLPRLEVLNLSCNHLRFLPDPIFRLPKLRVLDISYNKLVEIPTIVANLRRLEQIDITGNLGIVDLPSELFALPSLRAITVLGAHATQSSSHDIEFPTKEELHEHADRIVDRLCKVHGWRWNATSGCMLHGDSLS